MEEFHKTLAELRLELEKVQFEREDNQAEVNQSVAALEEKLKEESLMSGDEYLVHELTEALEHFEETHPQLTDILGRMSDLLSKMGI